MGRKSLSILALLAILLVACYVALQRDEKPARVEREALFPGLAGQLAGVRALEVRRPGQPEVRVQRDGSGWVMPAKADYPVRAQPVAEVLRALHEARKVEAKTDNPALFGRLGLSEDGAVEMQATRLSLERDDAAPLVLLVGKPARQGKGQLVRVPGETQVWLIDRDIELPQTELAWLDRRVAAVPFASIRRLDVRQAQAGRLTLLRETKEQANFRVEQLTADKKLPSESAANAIPALFANLEFADAAPLQQLTFTKPAVLSFSLETFSGGQLSGRVHAQGDQYWLVEDSRANLADGEWPGHSDWAYRLEPYQYQTLATTLQGLLGKS
ncbi:DUF4340 domain-containing protein [Pseudomonas sp. RIT-PI-AD]|uniref:DUF4340 domain-containing protein n=1 Tax=Pseudomonas sp. RIT-PI-AD TaxID=3035294 RepID=UPI0021D8BBA0|nr:DUF4340 domain-containing protein [Pseudomonas sp. RIT-PI-AD]